MSSSTMASNDARTGASLCSFSAMAERGAELSVLFLGGSLTWGANATDPQATSYRALIADRLRQKYPLARFRFWDAAIGGTGSQLAVFRLERDVLPRRPDLVFLDFSANDDIYSASLETSASYEALVRRIISTLTCPVVQVILPFKWNTVPAAQPVMHRRDAHLTISRAYGTVAVDVIDWVANLVSKGAADPDLIWADPNDGAHPYDAGYAMFADAIWDGFLRGTQESEPCRLPEKMLFDDTYMHTARVRLSGCHPLPAGWRTGAPNRISAYFDMLMSRWLDDEVICTEEPGQVAGRLRLRFRGTMVMLFGEGTPTSGKYRAYIDGAVVERREGEAVRREFDAGSIAVSARGNTHHWAVLAEHLSADVEHTLEIEPVFTPGAGQELRFESVCVAGPDPRVVF